MFVRVVARTTVTARDLEHHSPHLRDLDVWYINHPIAKNISFNETQPTKLYNGYALNVPLLIVDPSSGTLNLPGVYSISLAADHISICKPSSRGHDFYIRFGAELRKLRDGIKASGGVS
jgi:hypothetical protein